MAFTAAAIASNPYLTGTKNATFPSGSEIVCERFYMDLSTTDLALNTIGQIGILPAGCVPVEVRVDGADVDSGVGAGVYQVGIWDGSSANLSSAAVDGGGAWGDTGTAVATAFDKSLTRTLNNLASVVAQPTDRKIGLKVTTAPTTAVAGRLAVSVWYRSNP